MTYKVFGGKAVAGLYRGLGHKYTSDSHRGFGHKHRAHSGGSGIRTVPHSTGLGGTNDGGFLSGNTHNALANGQNDKRPTISSYNNRARAAGNQLERQTKRQRGGL